MKTRVSLFVFVFVLVSMILAACAPAAQGFVALPDGLKVAITALIVWIVSWLFTKLILLIPFLKFLMEFKEPLALAIAAIVIEAIQNGVPDAYGAVVILGIQLLLAILALFGVGQVLKKRGVKLFM